MAINFVLPEPLVLLTSVIPLGYRNHPGTSIEEESFGFLDPMNLLLRREEVFVGRCVMRQEQVPVWLGVNRKLLRWQ